MENPFIILMRRMISASLLLPNVADKNDDVVIIEKDGLENL